MTSHHALIVDDSKTAQHLLKRMLEKYDLTIDTALSAEEALAYLSYNHPAVIFLDQHMKGMDGIEALKTIKANPHTALIPVIMYTAQEDDLFVSQAFALGASDIFSKSSMLPANLERVLRTLNVGPLAERRVQERRAPETSDVVSSDTELADDAASESAAMPASSAVPMPVPEASESKSATTSLEQVREQIGRLFEIHIADVRNQINSSTQVIVKKLASSASREQKPAATPAPALDAEVAAAIQSAVGDAVAQERQSQAMALGVLVVVLTLGMSLLGYLLLQTHDGLDQVAKSAETIIAKQESAASVKPTLLAKTGNQKPEPAVNPALLRAINWMQSADFQFDYGEQPLNARQLANLNTLVLLLAEGGYKGPLNVDIQFGNMCLESGENESWRLPRNDLAATSCKFLKDLNPRFIAADYVTLAFRNLERSLPPLQNGSIVLRLSTSGMTAPRFEYPMLQASTTAGEWNRAALRNNRIAIQLPLQQAR